MHFLFSSYRYLKFKESLAPEKFSFQISGLERLIIRLRLNATVVFIFIPPPFIAMIISLTSHAIAIYFQINKKYDKVLFHFPFVFSESRFKLKNLTLKKTK